MTKLENTLKWDNESDTMICFCPNTSFLGNRSKAYDKGRKEYLGHNIHVLRRTNGTVHKYIIPNYFGYYIPWLVSLGKLVSLEREWLNRNKVDKNLIHAIFFDSFFED
jgi:hypothetical protein